MQAVLCLTVGRTGQLRLTGVVFPPFCTLPAFHLSLSPLGLQTVPYAIVLITRGTRGKAQVLSMASLNDHNLTNNTALLLLPQSWYVTFNCANFSRDEPGLRDTACDNAPKITMIQTHVTQWLLPYTQAEP